MRSARIAESTGDIDAAIELLGEAEQRFPEELLPVQELLRLYETHERAAERESELRAILSKRLQDPGYPLAPGAARFLIDTAKGDSGILESMRLGLEARVAQDPAQEYLAVLADVQGRLELYPEARATLERLITIEPTYSAVAQAVRIDLDLGQWQSALDLISPLIADETIGPAFLTIYIELLAKTGQSVRVLEEVERLRSSQEGDVQMPAFQMLLEQVAWDLYDAGELERSGTLWRMVLEQDPESLEAQLVLANLFSTGEERLAREAIVDQQLESESEPGVLLDAGIDYLTAGDNQRAYELLTRAVPSFAGKEAAWFNLGLAALRLEKWDETVQAFQNATRIFDRRAESHSHLAAGLRGLERWNEAARALERALELNPERVVDYYYLSKCYLKMGDRAKATAAMNEYERRRGDD